MDMARMQAVADKTRAFYETNTAGCALLKVKEIATQPQPALCLTDYNFPKDMRRYLDDRAARLLHAMALRDGLADDTLPALAPWYGIAEHSAFLGGKVTFGEDTSWQDPVLEDACGFPPWLWMKPTSRCALLWTASHICANGMKDSFSR